MILLHDRAGSVMAPSECSKPLHRIDFQLSSYHVHGNAPLDSDNLFIATLWLYYLKACQFVKHIEISVNKSAIEIV